MENIKTCPVYKNFQKVSFEDIAQQWKEGGGSEDDCPAALIISSGEVPCESGECYMVDGGVWQITSPDTEPNSKCNSFYGTNALYNNCCGADNVRTHLYTDTSGKISCFGNFNNDVKVPNIVGKDHSGGGLGNIQYNWIGPFCHQGGFTCASTSNDCKSSLQTSTEGDNWGGGSKWIGMGTTGDYDQLFPFPYYYYGKFLQATGDSTCNMNAKPDEKNPKPCRCEQLVNGAKPSDDTLQCYNQLAADAINKATGICKAVYEKK